jgi:hypothetical protein
MSIIQVHLASNSFGSERKVARWSSIGVLALSPLLLATAALAASNSPEADARYRAEVADCHGGQSGQDIQTCLKEARAALKESRLGHLDDGSNAYRQNALVRCNALPAEDRDACRRRIEGEGTTSGSVREGGILREIVVPDKK